MKAEWLLTLLFTLLGYSTGAAVDNEGEESNEPVGFNTETLTYCGKGWFSFGDMCYRMGSRRKIGRLNWEKAAERCREEYQGHLVTVHSQELQDFLTTFMVLSARSNVWIGLNDRANESSYEWDDGTPVDFMNWEPTEPSGVKLDWEDCVEMIFTSGKVGGVTGNWNDIDCKREMQFICQKEKGNQAKKYQDPRFCSSQNGGTGWKFEESCFHLVEESKTWSEAEEYCVKKHRGHLATITDFAVGLYLKYVFRERKENVWIGIKITEGLQQKWTSGWMVGYENWPDKHEPEECTAFGEDGRWISMSCNRELPFICEYSTAIPPRPKPSPEGYHCPEQPDGWRDLGGEYCYYFSLKNFATWPEAHFQCMRRGGTLASIHSNEELQIMHNFIQYRVYVVLIGLHRHMAHDEEFVWADGSPVDFTKWRGETSEPSNENEKCVEMLTESLAWNDIDCANSRAFICSVRKVPTNHTQEDRTTVTPCTSGFTIGALVGAMLCVFFVSLLMGVVVYYFRLCDRGHDRVKKTSGTKLQSPSAMDKKPRYRSEIIVQDDSTYENLT